MAVLMVQKNIIKRLIKEIQNAKRRGNMSKIPEQTSKYNSRYMSTGCRFHLGVSHLLLLFTTVTCNYSRVYNSVSQKFTEKKKQDGEMHRSKIAVYCDPQSSQGHTHRLRGVET